MVGRFRGLEGLEGLGGLVAASEGSRVPRDRTHGRDALLRVRFADGLWPRDTLCVRMGGPRLVVAERALWYTLTTV